MTSKGHALSRDALIRTLTAYSGIATEDGAGDGTTLVDSVLVGRNDFVSGKTILIMSGDAKDEDKGATAFDNSDGKITLRGTGFSAQIKAGTVFRVLNISSIEIDIVVIQETIGQLDTAAATGVPTDTDPLMAYVKQVVNEILGPSGAWSNLNNEAINSLDLAIQYIAAVMGFNGANIFNPVVGGVARTNMDAVFVALDVVLQVIGANVDWIKEAAGNDNWGFGALRNHILTNKGLIETVDTVVDAINAAIGDDSFGLGALRNHILTNKGLIETVDTVTDLIWAALGHATWGLGALKALIDDLDADMVTHATALATHDTEVKAEIDVNEGKIDDLDADLVTHATALATHDTEVKTEINANETKIDDLDADLVTHATALATHDTEVKAQIDANETKIDDLDADLIAHEASQSTHRAVLVDVHDTDLPAVKTVADAIKLLADILDLTVFTQEAAGATNCNGTTWVDLLDKTTITKPTKICGFKVTVGGTWAGKAQVRITDGAGNKIFPFQAQYEQDTDFTSGTTVLFNFPVIVPIADGYKFQFRSTDVADEDGETLELNNLDIMEVG